MYLAIGIQLFTGNNCISKKNLHPIKSIYKSFKIYIYNHFDGFMIVYTPIIGCIKNTIVYCCDFFLKNNLVPF